MRIGVVFPGQGSQVVGMAGGLADSSPDVATLLRRASEILGYDVAALMANGPEERLRETRYSQPAIFVANLALYTAVGSALKPVVSAGHSFGEYCSLTIAGALSFERALFLVDERGKAMQAAAELAVGSMSAILGLAPELVRESVAEAQALGRVRMANFNAPGQIVISGDVAAVERASELALAKGAKRAVPLNVSGAWHSELMEPARVRFAPAVEAVPMEMPSFPVISNVDAKPYTDVATIKQNLIRSVTDEVLWHDAALQLVEERLDLVVEFGASPVLSALIKRLPSAPKTMHVGDAGAVARLRSLILEPEVAEQR